MSKEKPLVSVIIPAYKAEKFLPETLESVINQTYKNLEIIVVDDGSPTHMEPVVKPYMEKDSRIKFYRKENGGVSSARNFGFEKSSGDFIVFLDSDDIMLPENIEKKVQALINTTQDYGFAHSAVEVIDETSKRTGIIKQGKGGYVFIDEILWKKNSPIAARCANLLYKREVFNKIGLFNINLSTAADQELTFRLTKYYKGIYIPEVLILYRIHSNNMHSDISLMERDHILAYKTAEKLNLFPSNKIKKQAFSNMYLILAGSWWKDGNNKAKGLKFMWKSFASSPMNFINKMAKKFI